MFFGKKEKDVKKDPFYDSGSTMVAYFKCNKCGEVFMSHLRKFYDINVSYSGEGGASHLYKEFIGSNCQEKIHINAIFTRSFKAKSFDIIGGSFISKEEYERLHNTEKQ